MNNLLPNLTNFTASTSLFRVSDGFRPNTTTVSATLADGTPVTATLNHVNGLNWKVRVGGPNPTPGAVGWKARNRRRSGTWVNDGGGCVTFVAD